MINLKSFRGSKINPSLAQEIVTKIPGVQFICLDVANGYSEHFVEFVKKVRAAHPDKTIIAGEYCIQLCKFIFKV